MEPTSVRRAFGKAAGQYNRYAAFQYDVGTTLAQMISRPVDHVLDAGCGTGRLARLLQRQTGAEHITHVDLSLSMLRQVKTAAPAMSICADICRLPLADGGIACVYANLVLQWCDANKAIREIYRVSAAGGSFFFAMPVAGTFRRLRETWAQTDRFVHCIDFHDADVIAHAATAAGFRVAQSFCRDYETEYDTLTDFFVRQKNTGAVNLHPARRKTLSGKRLFDDIGRAYERFRNERGKLPVEYRVLFAELGKPS